MSGAAVSNDFAGRGATQKNGREPEGRGRSNSQMLHTPIVPDQQGVRDFIVEGVTELSAVEMNQILVNCEYEHQRSVSERHVAVLADLMKRGKWQPKSQIDFAVIGGRYILVNGYHRAFAQVRAGKKVVWNIALHHCKNDAELRSLYYAFDTNIRSRGDRDILKAVEFTDLTGVTAEVAASLYRAVPFLASKFCMGPKEIDFLTTKQADRRLGVAAEYAKAAQRFGAAIEGMSAMRRGKLKGGAVTAVAVVTFRYQSEAAWNFWTGVASMDGLKRGDPRLALCNDFMTRKTGGSGVRMMESFAPAIIAWNAFFNERPLQLIKVLDSFVPVIDGTPFDGKPVKQAA